MTVEKSPGKSCLLCGVGGSGMSALAVLLQARGWDVIGSDRSRDRGETPTKFAALEKQGIGLYPQDGSGITAGTGLLIVSSAVEDSIPDVAAAKRLGIPIKKRAEVLAEMFNAAPLSIAIGGTSGKSTTTAMTGWILEQAGLKPTVINGAHMANFSGSNAAIGGEGVFVAEVDESDGSIAHFRPSIAVLTNVSLDHKPMEELRRLFGDYLSCARKAAVINLDDMHSGGLQAAQGGVVTFSLHDPKATYHAREIKPGGGGVSFVVGNVPVWLQVPGRHNVANALAAMAAAAAAGVDLKQAAAALAGYRGIKRRFEIAGVKNGITVIDDFAHNPDKIAATLSTVHESPGRIIAVFQPHGFGPTKLMRADLVKTFAAHLHDEDLLIMPEIYYAGGTAQKDISSADIVADICGRGKSARFFSLRSDIPAFIGGEARTGDRIVVMGARDDTLPEFAGTVLSRLP